MYDIGKYMYTRQQGFTLSLKVICSLLKLISAVIFINKIFYCNTKVNDKDRCHFSDLHNGKRYLGYNMGETNRSSPTSTQLMSRN